MPALSPLLRHLNCALVVCPHTDDEFGCAGTIHRLVEFGVTVHYLAFSRCEESVPEGLPRDILEEECIACTTKLGIPEENVLIDSFRVRHFPRKRQEILERLVALRKEINPDLVLIPSTADTHQDHAVVSQEGFRAFKHSSILGYELPQNLVTFSNTAFVHLTEKHLETKIEALSSYRSQEFRPYATRDFIRGLSIVRGVQAQAQYAEAFELIRLVVRTV